MEEGTGERVSDAKAPGRAARRRQARRRLGVIGLSLVIVVDLLAVAALVAGALERDKRAAEIQRGNIVAEDGEAPDSALGKGQGGDAGHATPAPKPRACEKPTLIGTLVSEEVVARQEPRSDAPVVASLPRTGAFGITQVLNLLDETIDRKGNHWYKALLPIRPNGTTGYVARSDLRINSTSYRLTLDRDRFRLTLREGCRKLETFPVGLGTGATPTPVGRFYLTGLFQPPDPNTVYGEYIYTLSGYSEVLVNWESGGVIGLHGTNDPSSVGTNASHGCIRMNNDDIRHLARTLPLGTPISIS